VNLRSVAEACGPCDRPGLYRGEAIEPEADQLEIGSAYQPTSSKSAFATDRHRTVRSKRCLSNKTALAMIFKRTEAAKRNGV
jgi:hypothetical protein